MESILPPKQNLNDLINTISSRNDYNKTLKRLQRFLKKGAEELVTTDQGVKTTKYQVNEMRINIRTINSKRARIIKNESPSTEKGTMGSIREMNLRPLKTDINKIKPSMWKQIVEKLDKQTMDTYYNARDELYKENYIKSFLDAYGPYDKKLLERIKDIPAEVLVEMYYYDPNLQIGFNYPVSDEDIQANLNFYKDTLDQFMKERGYKY